MGCTKLILRMVGTSAAFAAGGAVTASVGSKVLEAVGYAGYSILEAVQMGAAECVGVKYRHLTLAAKA